MHTNLFTQGTLKEVYLSLQRDYKRDSRQAQIFDLVAFGTVFWIVRNWPIPDIAAAMVLVWALSAGLRTFIDNSNRNFFMHQIDWQLSREPLDPG